MGIGSLAGGSGCTVNQAVEVDRYESVLRLDGPPVAFRAGQTLSLREALALANQHNEDLGLEGEQFLRALVNRRRAVANFLPTLDLVPVFSFRDEAGGGGTGSSVGSDAGGSDDAANGDTGTDTGTGTDAGTGGGNGTDTGTTSGFGVGGGSDTETFDVPLEATINLFNGFRDVNRYRRDDFVIAQRRDLLLSVQERVLLDTARVYFGVLQAEAAAAVLTASLDVQQQRLLDTRRRVGAGLAQPLEVAQTESQLSQTRVRRIDARRDAANGRALLALLTGRPVQRSPLMPDYALPAVVGPIGEYFATAETSRRDLTAAAAAAMAARYAVDIAFGQYYPSVSLDLTGYLYRESPPDDRAWDGLLVANVPIFAAGRIHADVRDAWSFFREAMLLRSRLRRVVRQELETAHNELAAAEARLAELQVQLAAAEEAFRLAELTYQIGLADNSDRIQAQDNLLAAQLALAAGQYERATFYLDLVRAAGRLREELESLPQTDDATTSLPILVPATQAAEPYPFAGGPPATRPVGPIELRPVTRSVTRPATLPGAPQGVGDGATPTR